MEPINFIKIYQKDSLVQSLFDLISKNQKVHFEGLKGSLSPIISSSYYLNNNHTQLIICTDKEEASFFYNDLQNLIGNEKVALFPGSYKKPFEHDDLENANVLFRSELISRLTAKEENLLIVTYAEALIEKVINKQSLKANSLFLKVGDQLELDFITELLISYDFENSDFVYEPGQFSIRGGIIDIFSYSSDLPVRIELFGNEIESLRYFSPEDQLSFKKIDSITLLPDVQKTLKNDTRTSIFNFLPEELTIWTQDLSFSLDRIDQNTEIVEQTYQQKLKEAAGVKILKEPDFYFTNREDTLNLISKNNIIEFGTRHYFSNAEKIKHFSKPQPSFNKDFNLLINDLIDFKTKGFSIWISTDSVKQKNQLTKIIQEISPGLEVNWLNIALHEGFVDHQIKLLCYTDHQFFERLHRYKVKDKFSKSKALTIKELKSLKPGDFVSHIDYGIGRFAGMHTNEQNGKKQDSIRLIYKDNDVMLVNVHNLHKIAKYSASEGTPPTINKLGSDAWDKKKSKVKKQIKDIAHELISLYAKRRAAPGFAFSGDNYLQAELETSFLYEDTPDQASSSQKVKEDMEKRYPMDRLVCGDVGFGKTEVAIRAAFKAVNDSKQVAMLVPTTILAMQHFKTFSERLEKLPVNVDYINRFKSAAETKETLKKVEEGKIDILIGTHKILNKKIKFKDLGLLIIDEEQKFGVKAKDRIKEIKLNVDILTLTATPIPRTLHFSLMGARDLSIISTPPPNRIPVTTEVAVFNEELIRDVISYEINRGGQVFFVHNRVKDIDAIAHIVFRMVPDAKIGVAHGQMDGDKLEKVMVKFIEGETNVLISTNIIESGLDIPNANTIIINQAHMFGMSDLHQMRGRVGRSNKKAFCYLLTPPLSTLTSDARKRLQTLEEFSDLGEGFKVAMRDLDIRGAGNLLGSEQSGFINDLGYEIYHKILDDAVSELKETEFKNLFEEELSSKKAKYADVHIETDLEILIPETYISNISERLGVYNDIDNLKDEEELEKYIINLTDRFGKLPQSSLELFELVKIRWKAETLGFEKISIKNNILKCYFVSSKHEQYFATEKFGKILDYVKQNPKISKLNQKKDQLILQFNHVNGVNDVFKILNSLITHIENPIN